MPLFERPIELGSSIQSGPNSQQNRGRTPQVSAPEALRPVARPVDDFEGAPNVSGEVQALQRLQTSLNQTGRAVGSLVSTATLLKKRRDREAGRQAAELEAASKGLDQVKKDQEAAGDDSFLSDLVSGRNPWEQQGRREGLGNIARQRAGIELPKALAEAGLNFSDNPDEVRAFVADYYQQALDAGGGNRDFIRGFHEKLGPAMAQFLVAQSEQAAQETARENEDTYAAGVTSLLEEGFTSTSPELLADAIDELVLTRQTNSQLPERKLRKQALDAAEGWALKKIQSGDEFTLTDLKSLTTNLNKVAGDSTQLGADVSQFVQQALGMIISRKASQAEAFNAGKKARVAQLKQAISIAEVEGDSAGKQKALTQLFVLDSAAAAQSVRNTDAFRKASGLRSADDTASLYRLINDGRITSADSLDDYLFTNGIVLGEAELLKAYEEIPKAAKRNEVNNDPVYKAALKDLNTLIKRHGGGVDDDFNFSLTGAPSTAEFQARQFLNAVRESFVDDIRDLSLDENGLEVRRTNRPLWRTLIRDRKQDAISDLLRLQSEVPVSSDEIQQLYDADRLPGLLNLINGVDATIAPPPGEIQGPQLTPSQLDEIQTAKVDLQDHVAIQVGSPTDLPTMAWTSPDSTRVVSGIPRDEAPGALRAIRRVLRPIDQAATDAVTGTVSDVTGVLTEEVPKMAETVSKGLSSAASKAADDFTKKQKEFAQQRQADAVGREELANRLLGLDPIN